MLEHTAADSAPTTHVAFVTGPLWCQAAPEVAR